MNLSAKKKIMSDYLEEEISFLDHLIENDYRARDKAESRLKLAEDNLRRANECVLDEELNLESIEAKILAKESRLESLNRKAKRLK